MTGCSSTLTMSKIKVKISEIKFLSFYKTLVQVVKLLEEFEGAKKQNLSVSDEQNELSRNKDQQKIQGDVNEQDVYGWSNLHWSTFFGKYAQCQDLLSAGADVNLPDEHGFTPLFVSARRGNFEISKLLLHYGADVQRRNYLGKTAINMATEKSFFKIEQLLKKY